jgi:hypothetical protein
MGLKFEAGAEIAILRIAMFVVLSVVWGWVVWLAFAYLITMVIPIVEPYAMGLLRINLTLFAPEANLKILRLMLWSQLS